MPRVPAVTLIHRQGGSVYICADPFKEGAHVRAGLEEPDAALADAWLAAKDGTVRAYTHKGYSQTVAYLADCFPDDVRLDRFDLAHVKRFNKWLADEKGNAEPTRNKHIRALYNLLAPALEDGKITKHPIPRKWWGKPRPDLEKPRAYSPTTSSAGCSARSNTRRTG